MDSKQALMVLGGMGFLLAGESQAMTMEERMIAMEKKMAQLENKLATSEQENQRLKATLGTVTPPKPEAASQQAIKAVDDKLAVLSKRVDTDKKAATEAAKQAPKISVSTKGVNFKSADENYQLNLRGYAQADGNYFIEDNQTNIADNFNIRRVRLTLDGTLFKNVDFRIAPDFAGSRLQLFDAFIDLHYFTSASLMAGKFRQPVSLERMQTAPNLTFIERAYPATMAPNRDLGFMLHGAFAYPGYKVQYTPQPMFKEFLSYEVGVFNGVRDSQAVNNADNESDSALYKDNKELAARVFSHPFSHSGSALEGLGIGVAGTWGQPKDNPLNSLTSSSGRQRIVSYGATTTATGESYRIYPQMYWYWKSFGMMGEYLLSSQHLHNGNGPSVRQENSAWHVNMSYVLTGENNSFFGVKPTQVFDPVKGTWGALLVAARWSEMDIDGSTFSNGFASLNSSVSHASSWTIGLNWYLNDNVKIMADYEQTQFLGGAAGNANRPDERVFLSRLQMAF